MGVYSTKGVTENINAIQCVLSKTTIPISLAYAVEKGLTKLVFSEVVKKTLSYYGKVEGLSGAKKNLNLAATTVGGYALFGGGYNGSAYTYESIVDAYDENFTHSILTSLSETKADLAATTVGGYALFGGGSTVDAYDEELTQSIPTGLSLGRSRLAATKVGKYALFGGGYCNSTYQSTVDAYDEELTRSIPTELSVARYYLAATTVGGYALFGGGTREALINKP